MNKSRPRAKSVKSDKLQTVLYSLTAEQLREVAHYLKVKSPGNIKEVIIDSILTSGRSLGDILKTCFRSELFQVKKHLFIARYSGEFKNASSARTFQAKRKKHIGTIELLHSEDSDFAQYFLFDHQVESFEMLPVEGEADLYRKTHHSLRHPISITLDTVRKIIVITYSGYTQGKVEARQRVHYIDVVTELLDIFTSQFGIYFQGIQIRESLSKLSQASERRVIVNRTHPRTGKGEMDLRGYLRTDTSAADFLVNLLEPYLGVDPGELRHGVSEALKYAFSESEIAVWKKESVSTKISYSELGAEFLFIWSGAKPTNAIVNSIVDLILSVETISKSPEREKIWDQLIQLGENEIFTTTQAIHNWQVAIDQCREILKAAIGSGMITPVFRIKTEKTLEEIENDWTTDLAKLNGRFSEIDGGQIDGSDPANVELGFMKLPTTTLAKAQ